jgi:hypothetical protein
LDINGLTFDTTSENTGVHGGICKFINEQRKELWGKVQEALPEELQDEYIDLIMIACCDHVAQVTLTYFLKTTVEHFKSNGLGRFVISDRLIIVPMFEVFGNILASDIGQMLSANILDEQQKAALDSIRKFKNPGFKRFEQTRYLSLPNIIQKFFEYEEFVKKEFDRLLGAGMLTPAQKEYWLKWSTSPLLRGVVKNPYSEE